MNDSPFGVLGALFEVPQERQGFELAAAGKSRSMPKPASWAESSEAHLGAKC